MHWTDLITEKLKVLGIYKTAPSLEDFIIESLYVSAGYINIRGDFSSMPEPLPKRWKDEGFTNCSAEIQAISVVKSEIHGSPKIQINSNNCLIAHGSNILIEQMETRWEAPDRSKFFHKKIICESSFIKFEIICELISVSIKGYGPSAI